MPEVETVVRGLIPRVTGARVQRIEIFGSRTIRNSLEPFVGETIGCVTRHGKLILLHGYRGAIGIHLGMTGRVLLDAQPSRYCQVVFQLESGVLLFEDVRQFGNIRHAPNPEELTAHLGPDALAISQRDFSERIRSGRSRIKPLLLNQGFLAGLGNIYVDEVLHEARIHPLSVAGRLGSPRARALHEAMHAILDEAIACGGSSISDYVNVTGQRGSYQLHHRVYGRDGQPCRVCRSIVNRIVVAQRGTHFCPHCQRL